MDLNKAKDLIGEHADKIDQGVDKAADLADAKTEGKYAGQIDQAAEALKDQVGGFLKGKSEGSAPQA